MGGQTFWRSRQPPAPMLPEDCWSSSKAPTKTCPITRHPMTPLWRKPQKLLPTFWSGARLPVLPSGMSPFRVKRSRSPAMGSRSSAGPVWSISGPAAFPSRTGQAAAPSAAVQSPFMAFAIKPLPYHGWIALEMGCLLSRGRPFIMILAMYRQFF